MPLKELSFGWQKNIITAIDQGHIQLLRYHKMTKTWTFAQFSQLPSYKRPKLYIKPPLTPHKNSKSCNFI